MEFSLAQASFSAYEIERDQAVFPRIVVDARLSETLVRNRLLDGTNRDHFIRQLSKCLKRDDDGLVFIDYLGFMGQVLKCDRRAFLHLVAALFTRAQAKLIQAETQTRKRLQLGSLKEQPMKAVDHQVADIQVHSAE
jgi:hypothetical protein